MGSWKKHIFNFYFKEDDGLICLNKKFEFEFSFKKRDTDMFAFDT